MNETKKFYEKPNIVIKGDFVQETRDNSQQLAYKLPWIEEFEPYYRKVLL